MNTTIEQNQQSAIALQVIIALQKALKKSPTGVSFVKINGYKNQKGEISNILINVGASYENQKNADLKTLQNCDITKMQFSVDMPTVLTAKTELENSLIKPDQNRSNGQIEAYIPICKGIKLHSETGVLYIFGMQVKKEVIVKGEYKTVKSQNKTIAKNELKKQLDLKLDKFRQYSFDNITNLKLNKDTIEL